VLVGGRVYFLAFSLAGPDSTPYREVDQPADVVGREHPPGGAAGLGPALSRVTAARFSDPATPE